MLTPEYFKMKELSSQQRLALWFHDMVQEAIRTNNTSTNTKYCIDSEEQTILVKDMPIDIANIIKNNIVNNTNEIEIMLKSFGWTVEIDRNYFLKFHWNDEQISANDELVRKYKYVTLNSEMWEYGHTDMAKFDVWFDQVVKSHQSNPSHYELMNQCLAIPYKEIKQANKAFIKNVRRQVSNDDSIDTITLQKSYIDHLRAYGWYAHDNIIGNENWLICSWQ